MRKLILDRMKSLIEELNSASKKYYNGEESPLSDKEFDEKLKYLQTLEQETNTIYSNSPTINVGYPILGEIKKVKITDKPMLSLDKVHKAKEVEDFANGYDLIASVKCDGLSVRLIYENGNLISANTRGNGEEGGDVTEHVKYFLNVPSKIKKQDRFVIDGEAIIYNSDFEVINKNNIFKNNRNTVSGALSLLDMSIVKQRRISFIAWDIIVGGDPNYFHYSLEEAGDLGFTVVPALVLDATHVINDDINKINKNLFDIAKENGIPCDGVVWRINDLKEGNRRGQTAHHFLNAVAWKPQDDLYDTKLINIQWTMGRTGVLTPVAVFAPVEIEGSIVSKASLHNYSIMRELLGSYVYVGEPLKVFKAQMIIPQIKSANPQDKSEIEKEHFINTDIHSCPYCNKEVISVTTNDTINLYCNNPQCQGKLINILDHFCSNKGLEIKGLSKATLEKLIDWEYVSNIKDIFTLKQYKNNWIDKTGFGEKSVNKILSTIDSICDGVELWRVISAAGIPLIGTTVSKDLARYFKTWECFRNFIKEENDFTQFPNFGYEMAERLLSFDYSAIDFIVENYLNILPVEETIKAEKLLQDKIFCLTGKSSLGSRDKIKTMIEEAGGKVTTSVTSKTDYLLANKEENTIKYNNAKKFGIIIINDSQLEKLIKEG